MKWLLLVACLSLSSCLHAPEQKPGKLKSAPAIKVHDPVCGKSIDTSTPRVLEYRKGTYYFCSQPCVDRFRSEPEAYLGRRVPPV